MLSFTDIPSRVAVSVAAAVPVVKKYRPTPWPPAEPAPELFLKLPLVALKTAAPTFDIALTPLPFVPLVPLA